MPIVLRPLEESATKYAQRAAAAAPEYEKGIKNPRRDQNAAALAAKGSYEAGVQEGISRDAFSRGLRKSSTADWQARASSLGTQRFPSGVQAGKTKWATGFAPSAQVLTSLSLPQKGPRGSAANFEISRMVGTALAEKRKSGS